MNTKTQRTISEYRVSDVTFAERDAKGRAFGLFVYRFEATFTESPADARSWHTVPAGFYYAVIVQAARGGEAYGAGQPPNYFTTEEKRGAYITQRIAKAQKMARRSQS